ncbi:MAG: hypothetical protein WCC17_04825 [Candidatus Nitrosopolaris sp.]
MMFGYKAGTQERAVSSPPARTLPAHTHDMYKDFYGGYHDGAVAADNDNSSGKGVDFHGYLAAGHSQEYCKGYEAGYNDEVRCITFIGSPWSSTHSLRTDSASSVVLPLHHLLTTFLEQSSIA